MSLLRQRLCSNRVFFKSLTSRTEVLPPSSFLLQQSQPQSQQRQSQRRRPFSSTTSSSSDDRGDRFRGGKARVGFVGLGNMGLPMALNLVKDDVSVVAFDIDERACRKAQEAGMTIASSAGEIVARKNNGTDGNDDNPHDCDVIFTMLPGCDSVDATMRELLDHVPEGAPSKVVVDCSTVGPATSRYWHEQWGLRDHVMLDAPVSGGVRGAADGTLTFMIGYHFEEGMEVARPYMEAMGTRLIACGGPGAGSATKLCNNLALAAQMVGICEAMNLGESLKVDPVVLADVMNQSTAKCWSCEVNNPHPAVAFAKKKRASDAGTPAARDYEGGFGVNLMLKDLGLAVHAASEAGVATPLTAQTMQLYRLAEKHGLGAKDFGVMLQLLKGTPPPVSS